MIQRVVCPGVELPRLYIADNNSDFQRAKDAGIPVLKWKDGMESFLRQLFRPALEQMFPGIKWDEVLGKRKRFKSDVHIVHGAIDDSEYSTAEVDSDSMIEQQLEYDTFEEGIGRLADSVEDDTELERYTDIAESERDCIADRSDEGYECEEIVEDIIRIEDYVGDLTSKVNIEALQSLGMLPKFVGDIADVIRHNLSESMAWTEGYTKKLGYPLGKFNCKKELPNLIIIDVSHSIPDGIAATMLTLADTLREQCNADLIITSRRSGFYPAGAELPKPQTLRDYYGRSNESAEFMGILDKYIAGREFGHVISFGDNDCPGSIFQASDWFTGKEVSANMTGTRVHVVHHFHTSYSNTETGYAKWVKEIDPNAEVVFEPTNWCSIINRKYTMEE